MKLLNSHRKKSYANKLGLVLKFKVSSFQICYSLHSEVKFLYHIILKFEATSFQICYSHYSEIKFLYHIKWRYFSSRKCLQIVTVCKNIKQILLWLWIYNGLELSSYNNPHTWHTFFVISLNVECWTWMTKIQKILTYSFDNQSSINWWKKNCTPIFQGFQIRCSNSITRNIFQCFYTL